ncbi:MAG TPA: DUF1173 family protein [Victivallales bacterium]|nr:DUF1173 family protein [Victivallales bacterium]
MITSFKVFNKTYSTSDLRESYIQNILRNARNNSSRIYCQCKGILAPVPMSSCLRNGNYYLKTLKNQEHGSQCRYFKQSINTSNCNSKQAVIITENNGLNIKLGLDFNAISSPNKKTISTSKQSPQSTAKSHTTRPMGKETTP